MFLSFSWKRFWLHYFASIYNKTEKYNQSIEWHILAETLSDGSLPHFFYRCPLLVRFIRPGTGWQNGGPTLLQGEHPSKQVLENHSSYVFEMKAGIHQWQTLTASTGITLEASTLSLVLWFSLKKLPFRCDHSHRIHGIGIFTHFLL